MANESLPFISLKHTLMSEDRQGCIQGTVARYTLGYTIGYVQGYTEQPASGVILGVRTPPLMKKILKHHLNFVIHTKKIPCEKFLTCITE